MQKQKHSNFVYYVFLHSNLNVVSILSFFDKVIR